MTWTSKGLGVGTDIEFFGKKKGKIIPLDASIVPGTKDKPEQIGETAFLQLDNVLGEITFEPSYSAAEFYDKVIASKREVGTFLSSKGISPVYKSAHFFNPNDLQSVEALTAGCEPDFAANDDEDITQVGDH